MKIELLLKRESFYQILFETLQSFLKSITNKEHHFYYKSNNKKNTSIWFVNPKLNVIFSKYTCKTLFEITKKEFCTKPGENKFKRLFRSLYIYLSLNSNLYKFFSKKKFYVTPSTDFLKTMLILGGNHRIRLIDNLTKSSYVILKKGEPSSWITNEITFRKSYNFDFIPKLISSNIHQNWYQEQLISGIPINRLAEYKKRNYFQKHAFESLNKLYQQTEKIVSTNQYVKKLTQSILDYINTYPIFQPITKKVDIVTKQFLSIPFYLEKIPIVMSHGDFQEANILIENQKLWIIDWENVEMRSKYYDFFTFELHFRHLDKLKKLILDLNNLEFLQDNNFLNLIQIKNKYTKQEWENLLAIALIENLQFMIVEHSNNNCKKLDYTLLKFITFTQFALNRNNR